MAESQQSEAMGSATSYVQNIWYQYLLKEIWGEVKGKGSEMRIWKDCLVPWEGLFIIQAKFSISCTQQLRQSVGEPAQAAMCC